MSDIKNNIEKLFFDSDVTNYKIYKATGIRESSLSDIKNKKTKIGNIKLDNAIKLNDFYLKEVSKKY